MTRFPTWQRGWIKMSSMEVGQSCEAVSRGSCSYKKLGGDFSAAESKECIFLKRGNSLRFDSYQPRLLPVQEADRGAQEAGMGLGILSGP